MAKRTLFLIAGLTALALAAVVLIAALSISGTGAAERIPPKEAPACSMASASQPASEASKATDSHAIEALTLAFSPKRWYNISQSRG